MKSRLVAGIDEAGRGPLAGPVVAAAVILHHDDQPVGLADSKTLSAETRERLAQEIEARAIACSVAWSDAAEVDSVNILNATLLAMRRAIIGLQVTPSRVEVDGNRLPDLDFGDHTLTGRAIVKGDQTVAAISAASILAKVARDRIMVGIDRLYPDYGFARHKGYGTAEHREQIQMLGPCVQHRRTFRPISSMKFGEQSD
jgi:ribonuclease HII